MKVKEFLEYEVRAKNLSPLTVRNYRRHLKEFCVWLEGRKDLDEITPEDIIAYMMHQRNRDLSPSSCNIYLATLRCYFDYCVRFQGMKSNPAAKVEKMKTPSMLPQYIQEFRMKLLFDKVLVGNSFKQVRSRAILAFFYMTGARCAEVSNVALSDIDWQENKIYLFGKGRKQRMVPMCSKLKMILTEYLKFRSKLFPDASRKIFVNVNNGEPLTDWELRVIVKAALVNVVPESFAHPHILRHTFATVLMNHGKAIQDISRWLGHTSIAVTQRYLTICANPKTDNFETVF